MALIDHKITELDVRGRGVQSAPDHLTGTAAENKAVFDRLIAEVVREKLNALIDEVASELAGKMAAPESDGSAGQYLRTDGAGGRTWGTPSGAGDMLQSQYDSDGDGRVDEAGRALLALSAAVLTDARAFRVTDADGSHRGGAVPFDGSGDVALPLPATIRADLEGNASSADRATVLRSKRKIGMADFDGSGDVTLVSMGAAAMGHSHSNYLPLTGGALSGRLTLGGALVGNSGVNYGTEFPAAPVEGQIFFKKV